MSEYSSARMFALSYAVLWFGPQTRLGDDQRVICLRDFQGELDSVSKAVIAESEVTFRGFVHAFRNCCSIV